MSLFSQKNRSDFNIVFVIDSLIVGGAESQLVMLAGELHKRGYHCEVFALRAEGGFCKALESLGVPVNNGSFSLGRNRIALLRGMWGLWRCVFRNRPCVVHTFLPLSNFIGSLVGRLAGASVVITSRRGLGIHQDSESRWKYFDRISNALSSKVSVNSKAVEDDMKSRDGIDSKKIVCIYNGLDLQRFIFPSEMRESMRLKLSLSPSDFAWVKVANFASCKGHIDLLQSFSTFSCNCSTRLFLVGEDRGEQHRLEKLVSDLGVEDKVVFLGGCNNVPEILSAMDAYVMASHSEGFSNAILEAMAAGLPIVATTVGGNAEALQNGKGGVLVPPNNPEALAFAMQKIMNDHELSESISAVAKQAANQIYNVEIMVTAYLELYQSGLER